MWPLPGRGNPTNGLLAARWYLKAPIVDSLASMWWLGLMQTMTAPGPGAESRRRRKIWEPPSPCAQPRPAVDSLAGSPGRAATRTCATQREALAPICSGASHCRPLPHARQNGRAPAGPRPSRPSPQQALAAALGSGGGAHPVAVQAPHSAPGRVQTGCASICGGGARLRSNWVHSAASAPRPARWRARACARVHAHALLGASMTEGSARACRQELGWGLGETCIHGWGDTSCGGA